MTNERKKEKISFLEESSTHTVYRVLRIAWDPLNRRRVYPPPLVGGGGGHTHLRERGRGVPIRTRGQTLWYSRYIRASSLSWRVEAFPDHASQEQTLLNM